MGMYTELNMTFEIREDAPEDFVRTLRSMLEDGEPNNYGQTHRLFSLESARWKWMLRFSSDSFAANQARSMMWKDEGEDPTWHVVILCSFRNYEGEVEAFVDWVTPYIVGYRGDFLGYSRLEAYREPELIYLGGR